MASKNKRRQDVLPNGGLRHEVERLIAKDRLKDAVKQAKLCYREESTPEHHRLLERAYLLRADQLRRNAMPAAAQEVARHLLDFGITDPALVEEAARLLVALGMSRAALVLQGRLDSAESRERLALLAADLAVLHPERALEPPPEIRQGAQPVRAALEALQAGDESKALDALRDVARSSPFGDWKLFVRGLAAYSRRAAEEVRANWDRLDPRRAASRIARSLLALNGLGPDGPSQAGIKLDALERRVFGVPVLEPVEQLRALVAQDRWDEVIRRIGPLRPLLQRVDPKLVERLTQALYGPLIRAASQLEYRQAKTLIKEFTYAAQPLPIDPRWNRLWALLWEGPQGGLDEAEGYWRKYLKDLENLPSLAPEERALAQALVWKHLGKQLVGEAEALAGTSFGSFGPRSSDRGVEDARKRAVACLEEGLRLAPAHRDTYHVLLDAYQGWDQPEQAAAVARRLLEEAPDDFEAIMFLSEHHFRRDDPVPALEYVRRARELKPLDPSAAQHEWAVHVLMSRHLAFQGRWDEGRAEFAAAERAWPEWNQTFHFLAREAVFDLKAGPPDRAEALIAAAQERLAEPTPLWLALLIEAIRYKLPQPDRGRFEARWTGALTKRRLAETAGALAELIASFMKGDFDYPGRAGHLKQVVDYLRRTTRLKYRPEDLARVCSLLGLIPKERALFEAMVKRGLRLFPESPVFLMLAGSMELEKGPFAGNLTLARKHFEKALERVQASSDPRDAKLLPKIQESLSMLKDLTAGPMGMPFAGFGGGPFPSRGGTPEFRDILDAMRGMMGFEPDDLDDDDDESDEDDEPPPRPLPRRPSPGRKRKKG